MFKKGQSPKKSLEIGEARKIKVFYEPTLVNNIIASKDGVFQQDEVYEGLIFYNISTESYYVYAGGEPLLIESSNIIPNV